MIYDMITKELPSKVIIDGKEVPINTDFRIGIQLDALLNSKIKDEERILKMLLLYYPRIPNNLPEAIEKIVWFYGCGECVEEQEETKKRYVRKSTGEPAYSFSKDAAYIYSIQRTVRYRPYRSTGSALVEIQSSVRFPKRRDTDEENHVLPKGKHIWHG